MVEQAAREGGPKANLKAVTDEFTRHMDGMLKPEKIEAAVTALETMDTAYPAQGSAWSAVFFLEFQVTIDGGKTFNGKAGGISSPGGGALFGDVYTDDIDRLYNDTVSFEFQAAVGYTSLVFFDSDSNTLGHFQAGAVSTISGIGGGSGGWS